MRQAIQDIFYSFNENRLLYVSALFIPIISGLFFFIPTSGLRNISYLSFIFSLILFIKDRDTLKEIISRFKSIWMLLFIFLIYMTFSVFWSEITENGRAFEKGKLIVFISMALLSSFYLSYKIPNFLNFIKNFYIWAAIISAIILIIDYFITQGITISSYRLEGMGRAANPVQCSFLYGLSIIAIMLSKFPERFKFPKNLAIKICMCMPPFVVMLLTQSRGPLLSLVLTTILIFLMNSKNKIKATLYILISLSILAIPSYFILRDTSFIDRKSTGRTQIWQSALVDITASPIYGYGIASNRTYTFLNNNGTSETTSHIHNLYLSTLFQGGLIGLVLLISIYGMTFRKYIALSPEHQSNLTWIGGWMLMGAIFGLTDFGGIMINLSTEWLVFWWPIGLILGYMAQEQNQIKLSSTT